MLSEGDGVSRRGTQQNAPFNGDVIRKMLNNIKPEDLIVWYNKNIGKAYLRQSSYRPSFHILDCTDLEVNYDNDKYEGSGKVKQGFCVELCVLFMSSVSFVTNIGTQTQMVSCNLAKNESAHDCRKHQENNTDLYGHHGNQHITHTSSSFR